MSRTDPSKTTPFPEFLKIAVLRLPPMIGPPSKLLKAFAT